MKIVLQAAEVEKLICKGFESDKAFFKVEELSPGRAKVKMPFQPWMRRPGNVISGPALFTAADLAMYALVISHMGPELMAVTSNMNLNFLSKGAATDIHAEASILKLGRKLIVMEVRMRCGDEPTLVAQATGSYAMPSKKTEAVL